MLEQGIAALAGTGFRRNKRGVWLSILRHGLPYQRTFDGLPHERAPMWNQISFSEPT